MDEAIEVEFKNSTLKRGPESISDENFSRKRKLLNDNKHSELHHSCRIENYSSQETENDSSQETENDSSQEAENDSSQEIENDSSQEIENDSSQETENDSSQEAENDTSQEAENDSSQETENDSSQEAENDSSQETENDSSQEIENDSSQETENDSSQETENDSSKETENDFSQETEKESDILVENTNSSNLIEFFDDYNLDELDELTSNDGISSDDDDDDDDSESEEEEFESDETKKRPTFIWNKVNSVEFKAKPLEFTGLKKAKITCQNTDSPLEIFKCLLNDSIINFIINETNLYGEKLIKCCQARNTENKYFSSSKWQKLTKDEFFKYIGIVMYMSLKPLLKIKDYWSKTIWGSIEVPKHMSRDRFLDIDRCLHFWNAGNINDAQGQVKLKQINHLLNLFKTSFANSYYPTANLVLDESIVGWKGQLSFKTYIKSKHSRFGIKLCVLRDSSNGYHLNFLVYSGDNIPIESWFGNDMPCATKTEKIVCALVEPYIKAGHTLYVDSYYNSPLLCAYLRGMGLIDVVGIVHSNGKQYPSNLAKLVVAPNESVDFEGHCLGSHVLLQKWAFKKGKYLNMITTKHNNDMVVDGDESNIVIVKKPLSVEDYNKTIGEVDTVDQMLQPFKMECRKRMKWALKLFKRMLAITVDNSYIIHCTLTPKEFTLTNCNFRKILVEDIFLESHAKQAQINDHQFEGMNHVMTSNKKRRNCWYCPRYRGIKKQRTVWICPSCNNMQLCKDPCFIEFHRKLWAGELQI